MTTIEAKNPPDSSNSHQHIFNKDEIWDVINCLYKKHSLVRHQHESFAYYIQNIIPETILETVPLQHESDNYHFSYRYVNLYLHRPGIVENDGKITELTPNECRLRNLTYASPLFVTIEKSFTNKLTKETKVVEENLYCGMIPIMVKSIQCRLYQATEEELVKAKECIYDQGGHFIMNGTEKILVGMQRMSINQSYVFENKSDPNDLYCEITSIEDKAKNPPSILYLHLLSSSSLGKKTIRVSLSNFKRNSP